MTPRLLYILHSGQLFGTERMALATLQALGDTDRSLLMAPPGPVHAAARAAGVDSRVVAGPAALAVALARALWRGPDAAIVATGVVQSLLACALQCLLGGQGAHLHVVHGGTDERLSYGRKRLLARLPVRLVAVSPFVRQRLLAHGVQSDRIAVVGNFLQQPPSRERSAFGADGVRRVVMLSRLDRIKRVGLLFDALERTPGLGALQFDVYGSGEEEAPLRERARRHANVTLHGFVPDAAHALADADLLLHTCPEEPFGLVLLEAFAAGVPVLAPNSGGAGDIVHHGVNGWHFSANDAVALGQQLQALAAAPAARLDALAQEGRQSLRTEHDPRRQAQRYAQLAGLNGLTDAPTWSRA
jgi:glycosyltransferase involved in cell wall biosynthesis